MTDRAERTRWKIRGDRMVDDNPRIAQQFQIQSIPTLMVFKNGTTFRRQVGANPGIIPSMIEDALR